VSFAEDQHPVGDLGPGGEHEPFGAGVRAGASGRDLDGLDASISQHRVELAIPFVDRDKAPVRGPIGLQRQIGDPRWCRG
jgi:hypothetical protein